MNEVKEGGLTMWTHCCARIACLFLGRKQKMDGHYTPFPSLYAQDAKIG
jgi:hypothetical protein